MNIYNDILTEVTPLHLLVVGNDESDCARCGGFLAREGYRIRQARDGRHALEMIDSAPPDIILMDVETPRTDGLECTRQLKANPVTENILVILVGPTTEETLVVASLEAGADEYLSKPLRPKELVLRLRSMVRIMQSRKELLHSNEIRGDLARAMTILLDFSRDLVGVETLEDALAHTIGVTMELTCARRISILLPDTGHQFLKVAKSVGLDESVAANIHIPVGAPIAGQVFESGELVVINTADEAALYRHEVESELFTGPPLISMALSAAEHPVGVLNVTDRQGGQPFSPMELECVDLIANIAASAIHDIATRQARDGARDSIIIAFAKLAEHRHPETGRHLERVTRFSLALAQELRAAGTYRRQINDAFLMGLERAVPLHDIGKVGIPDHVLLKPVDLTPDEWDTMKTHTEIGAGTIRSVIQHVPGVRFLEMAEEIARAHHEWYDGTGYPNGIREQDIPLSARIVALADVYDAITTKRTYKEAFSHEKAVSIITESSGTQFDPVVVRAFVKREMEFDALARELADDMPNPANHNGLFIAEKPGHPQPVESVR